MGYNPNDPTALVVILAIVAIALGDKALVHRLLEEISRWRKGGGSDQ